LPLSGVGKDGHPEPGKSGQALKNLGDPVRTGRFLVPRVLRGGCERQDSAASQCCGPGSVPTNWHHLPQLLREECFGQPLSAPGPISWLKLPVVWEWHRECFHI
jgi:hypothetical protein